MSLSNSPTPVSHAKSVLRRSGFLVLLVFGLIGGWSVFARLDGGAHAPGRIIVEDKTQVIRHPDGGVLQEVLVKDGQFVKAGDALMYLSPIQTKAEFDRRTSQYDLLMASITRLTAEQNKFVQPVFDKNIPENIIKNQMALFENRKANIRGKETILRKKISAIYTEIEGLSKQLQSLSRQIELQNKSLSGRDNLAKSGYMAENILIDQKTKLADYTKEYDEKQTAIANAKQRIAETELEIFNLYNEHAESVADEIKTSGGQIADLEEQIKAAKDIFSRTIITSPVDGYVTNIQFRTVGGGIPPSSDIMSIVPANTKKMVEARLNPNDIDLVHKGMKAKVYFTAYKSIKIRPIDGDVYYVSADSLVDEKSGLSYYQAYVIPNVEQLATLDKGVILTPGMPVDVIIKTGERTPLDYMLSPLKDSLRQSFIEE